MPEHGRQFSPQFKAEGMQMVIPDGQTHRQGAPGPGDPRRDPGQLGQCLATGEPQTWEPPIGIEPMTYALREAREYAV